MPKLLKIEKQVWHSLPFSEVVKKMASVKSGLTDKEARTRLRRFGLNQLPQEKRVSRLRIFAEQFKSPLIYILLIAGFVTLGLQHWTDSVVIFAAVFLNAGIGFFQENKASRVFDKLRHLTRERAMVIRGGRKKEIDQKHIVVGDIIVLKMGDKVPADARLIETSGLKVNEAVLTGEWLAADKFLKPLKEETVLAERKNMVYMGTIVEDGKGLAVVVGMGRRTEIGQIARSIRSTHESKTPYQKKLANFSRVITAVVSVASIAIFIIGFLTGKDLLEMFVTAIAVAVAAIPEGLPIAITVVLALGMERISKKKGLVRKLIATETLGSTQIICTDKTGTLTEAKMQVAGVFTGSKELLSRHEAYLDKVDKKGVQSHLLALKIAMLCNEAFIENPDTKMNKWIVRGRPTEKALLLAGIQAGLNREQLARENSVKDILSFDSIYKYAAGLYQSSQKEDVIYLMGAPEVVLKGAKFIDSDGRLVALSGKKIKELKEKYRNLDRKGLRVLAVGYKKVPKNSFVPEMGWDKKTKEEHYSKQLRKIVFVGFIALQDPLREDVKGAIKTCRLAGMRPIIVTGDHWLTAQAIAKELGLPAERENIIDGRALSQLSEKEFNKKLKNFYIYARVEPVQKLRIIRAWQNRGQVVAMTGDGINDAPALKKADIGIAIGSGTDVAKETADIVLLTDNFSVIVAAIEEGRAIIDNIRKVITFLFADAFTEIILIGASVIGKIPLPFLPAQILWVNLLEDSFPAISLAFEKREEGVMDRPPERSGKSLLTLEMKTLIFIIGLITDFILLALFLWLLSQNIPLKEVRTTMFAALTIDSIFYIFSCKNLHRNLWQINIFSNRFLLASWLFSIFFLGVAIYWPIFQKFLKTTSLNFFDWLLILAIGLINLIFIEATKFFFIKFKKDR